MTKNKIILFILTSIFLLSYVTAANFTINITAPSVSGQYFVNYLPLVSVDTQSINTNCTLEIFNSSGVSELNIGTLINDSQTTHSNYLVNISSLIDGQTYNLSIFCVNSIDSSDNLTNQNITFLIDSTSPSTIDNVPIGWQNSNVTINLTPTDAHTSVAYTNYSINGGSWITGTDFIISTLGNNTLDYFSVDNLGNIESTNNVNVLIDGVAPSTILEGFIGAWSISPVTIIFNVSDSDSGVGYTNYSLDGGAWITALNVTIGLEGNVSLEYFSVDNVSNIESNKTVYVAVDLTNPTSVLESSIGWINSGNYPIVLEGLDSQSNISEIYYSLDGGLQVAGNASYNESLSIWRINFSLTSDGNHTIEFFVEDNAGLKSSNKTFYVALDTGNPSTLLSGNVSGWSGAPVNISFNASDIYSGINYTEYMIDSGNWTIADHVYINNSGNYTLSVRSMDNVGNLETETIINVLIDLYPPESNFISLWDVSIDTGLTGYNNLKLPLQSDGTYNFFVDWGDGTNDTITVWNQTETTHNYGVGGEYIVNISGLIQGFGFGFNRSYYNVNELNDANKLIDILQWGNVILSNNGGQFANTIHLLNFSAPDVPNLTGIQNLSGAFALSLFNGELNEWDVSDVVDMSYMFYYRPINGLDDYSGGNKFNQNLSSWNVSSVTNMKEMFYHATFFNQDISSWDVSNVVDMSSMFYDTHFLNYSLSNWNVSSVINMDNMFMNSYYNQPLNGWDVSSVTSMANMFKLSKYNQSLSNWDVSNVVDMSWMFANNPYFNQPLNSWDVSNVTNMNYMFYASYFNQPLNSWDVSNVNYMSSMFRWSKFNQNISSWNMSNVISISYMFSDASDFNQPLNDWDVSNIKYMDAVFFSTGTFSESMSFNQPLDNWDVSSVTNMANMFSGNLSFNQPLDSWNVSNVNYMSSMFKGNPNFNQPLAGWDVSNVTSMNYMFYGATSFNQPLDSWDVSNVTYMSNMFKDATVFNQNIGSWNISKVTSMSGIFDNTNLSIQNYDAILINWSNSSSLQNNVGFGAVNIQYCLGENARANLINNYAWTIIDGGKNNSCDIVPPITSIYGNISSWTNQDVNVTFNASDDFSGVNYTNYSLDSGTTWITGNWSFFNISGNNSLKVRSVDNGGNIENTTTIYVLIDKDKPTITRNSPLYTTDVNESINVTFADALSGINSSSWSMDFDGTPVNPGNTNATYSNGLLVYTNTNLSEGIYSISVDIDDNAGNPANTLIWNMTVDRTTPNITSFTLSDADVYVGGSITGICVATDNLDNSVSTSVTGISTSTGGTFTATCTATDDTGNSISSTTNYIVRKSSSGGSSGGSTSTSDPSQTTTFSEIKSGTTATIKFNKETLEIQSIELNVGEDKENVKITAKSLATKPINLASLTKSRKILKYLEIDHVNLDNENIISAKITFKVPKGWLDSNGGNLDEVILYRFTNVWDEITTRFLRQEGLDYVFESDSPGMSYFAIGLKEPELVDIPVEEVKVVTNEEVVVEPVIESTPTKSVDDKLVVEESKGGLSLFGMVIIVILIGLIMLFYIFNGAEEKLPESDKAIIRFVETQRELGKSEKSIENELRDAGWDHGKIQKIMQKKH